MPEDTNLRLGNTVQYDVQHHFAPIPGGHDSIIMLYITSSGLNTLSCVFFRVALRVFRPLCKCGAKVGNAVNTFSA